MKTLSRICFLGLGLFLLAHYLPEGYRLLVAKRRQRAPIAFYSCVQKDFFFYRYNDHGTSLVDEHGSNYEREVFEQKLPLDNYLQLLKNDSFPKSIDGIELSLDKVKRERLSIRVRPETMDAPMVPLYPLMEAESGRVRLEMPDDFMRLSSRVDFLVAASNAINTAKSDKFTKVFEAAGFVFPAKIVAGNATSMKPYDEGYFLVDNTGATFQLRMVKGEPDLKQISKVTTAEYKSQWEKLNPKFIMVQEVETHEMRAFILGGDDRPYLAVGKDYRLVQLPMEFYHPKTSSLSIRGDMLNRLITSTSDDTFEAVALNRNYDVVKRYHESLPVYRSTTAGQVSAVIFPFILPFENNSSNYYGFYPEFGTVGAIVLNGVLVVVLAGWLGARKQLNLRRVPDLLAVALGGFLGIIVVMIAPRPQ